MIQSCQPSPGLFLSVPCLHSSHNGRTELASGPSVLADRADRVQMTEAELGEIPGPITAEGPKTVPGEKDLTQDLSGPLTDASYKSRGYSVPGKVRSLQLPPIAPLSQIGSVKQCCSLLSSH